MEHPAAHAAERGDRAAVIMGASGEVLTDRQLDDTSNRVARLLRASGLVRGDHVAVLLTNRREWYEVVWGALRSGLYATPVNWHLTAAEAGYIVADCEATALVVDADRAGTVAGMDADADLAAVTTRLVVAGPGGAAEPRTAEPGSAGPGAGGVDGAARTGAGTAGVASGAGGTTAHLAGFEAYESAVAAHPATPIDGGEPAW